ncbi:MAG: glycoside hydrolase [Bacteroidota bacterium]
MGFLYAQQIVLEPSKAYQTMVGFGASDAWRTQFVGENWPIEKRNQIADWLFSRDIDENGNPKGIGLSLWRFCIGAGSTEQGEESDIVNEWRRSESFLDPDGTYDWSKYVGQKWFLQAAKERGVDQFLAFSLSAPVQYTINGKAYSIKGDERLNLKPGKYDDYAKYLVDVIEYFHEHEGISFDYLSPNNEPQWDWSNPGQEGSAATNEDLYLMTSYLSRELDRRNLKTRIVLGETGELNHLFEEYKSTGDQISTFFEPTSPLYIGSMSAVAHTISGHSYFTTWPIDTLNAVRHELAEKLAEYPDLGYWQSEYCILEESPEIGNGHKRDLGMPTALYVGRVIHADLTMTNATSWQWWTALTTWDFKDGLIYLDTGDPSDLFNRDRMKTDGDCHTSKLMWALGNYSRFIEPGMERFEASLEGVKGEVSISAYQRDSEFVLVLTNHKDKAEVLSLPKGVEIIGEYLTSSSHDLSKVDLSDDKSIQLPGRSLLTITGRFDER